MSNQTERRPFKPVVEQPPDWVNETVAMHGQLWDIAYQFTTHPTAVGFTRTATRLQVSAARTSVTLTTSRGGVLRVPAPVDVRPHRRAARARLLPRSERHDQAAR